MELNDDGFLAEAVNNLAPKLVDGGRKLRGPNATYDFIQAVWIETALLKTRALPAILEQERRSYMKQKKMVDEISTKGKYTDTTGWSRGREYKFNFSISPQTYNYFANIVGPYMDCGKEIWSDVNSKMWKKIKKLIIDGDKVGIAKLQKHIERCLLRELPKKIAGGISGLKTESSGASKDSSKDNI